MWRKSNEQNQQPNLNPNPQKLESREAGSSVAVDNEFERAAAETQAPPADAAQKEQAGDAAPAVPVSFMVSPAAAASIIRFPFAKLAARDHPAWIPTDQTLEQSGAIASVQGGLQELADKFMPKLLTVYAEQYPQTVQMLVAMATVLWMQMNIVRKLKAEEAKAAEASARQAGKTITVPAGKEATA